MKRTQRTEQLNATPRHAARATLARRVAVLEQEVQRLKTTLVHPQLPSALPWWERLAGCFADDPLFDEMVAAGQAYRRAQNTRSRRQ
jgi:hypothetical protein